VAASTSTLSTPTPARPTTWSLGAASITRLVILVADRTTNASTSRTAATSWSSFSPMQVCGSKPRARNSSSASFESSSQIRMRSGREMGGFHRLRCALDPLGVAVRDRRRHRGLDRVAAVPVVPGATLYAESMVATA